MSRDSREKYFRKITANVIQRYCELEFGVLSNRGTDGATFDPRALDYRIDVERVLDKLPRQIKDALIAIHRDGLSPAQALAMVSITKTTPARFIAAVETSLGQIFERKRLADMEGYLS